MVGLSHIQAGKLKALAIAATQRLEVLPDVPTMAEAGYPIEASYWFGLVAPAGTPPAVLAKLEKALADVLAMPDVRKRLTDMGAVVTAARRPRSSATTSAARSPSGRTSSTRPG